MQPKGFIQRFLLLCLLLLVVFFAALCLGRFSANPLDVLKTIFTRFFSDVPRNEAMDNVVFQIRLPRIVAAVLIGAALSVSGAAYQSTFRNPLVSPDMLGVSSGACVGAASAILAGLPSLLVQVCALVGSLISVTLSTSLPRFFRNQSNMMLLLSGIIVSGFMSAALGILKYIAEESTQLAAIVFWQMGSLAKIDYQQLISILPPILFCLLFLFFLSWRLNILSFGEEEAQSLGIPVRFFRAIIVLCTSLLTASAVSASGTIGWIGLVIPHAGRLLCGADNTRLLPVSAVLGALFLLIIDTLARTLTSMEIPLSILSGLVGAPAFVWLLYRQKARIS